MTSTLLDGMSRSSRAELSSVRCEVLLRDLLKLGGSRDVDVAAVLSQYRLVADFKAKTVRPNDEEYADSLAFEHHSLICDGPVITRYQQLSAVNID